MFLVQKNIFIFEFCIVFFTVFDKKKNWGIELSLFPSNRCNSYFKIFTQSQNMKVYEYFLGSLYVELPVANFIFSWFQPVIGSFGGLMSRSFE